jgi:hypothetical protein
MSEVISFLRSESEKQEKLLEELLNLELNCKGEIVTEKLIEVLQHTYELYSVTEELRESYPDWVLVDSNRIYDLIKSLIALKSLPEPSKITSFPKLAGKGMIVGYLYVFHLFQVHLHGLFHLLNSQVNMDSSVHRVFGSVNEDLSIRREFIAKVRTELSMDHKRDLAVGVNSAYADIRNILTRKSSI